jgi:hypothetical protein
MLVSLGIWLSLSASAVAFQNEPTGFRGIAWGTPFTTVQNQMRPSGYGYLRAADDPKFGDAALDKITYFFRDGAFDGVVLVTKSNWVDGGMLLLALRSSFGPPTEGKDDTHFWIGSRSFIASTCKLQQPPCWAAIFRTGANSGSQRQSDPVIERYHSCMTHCTTMYTICNMDRDDVGEMYKSPWLRCDNQVSACNADCKAEFRRHSQ